jgi:hypothetical protein
VHFMAVGFATRCYDVTRCTMTSLRLRALRLVAGMVCQPLVSSLHMRPRNRRRCALPSVL